MMRAAKLDSTLHDEIACHEATMDDAISMVPISTAAAGIGMGLSRPVGLLGGAIAVCIVDCIGLRWPVVIMGIGAAFLLAP